MRLTLLHVPSPVVMDHAFGHRQHRHGNEQERSGQDSSKRESPGEGGRNLIIALLLNVGITVAQIVGGVISGSLSLLADAAHNGSDVAALGISYGARRISHRQADRRLTFGYSRAKLIGAMINLTVLFVIALYLIYVAVQRFLAPPEVGGTVMLVVGGIAFVEDALSTWLLSRGQESSLNVRAAFIHMFADTLATVGVMGGGALILLYDIHWVDPAVTAAIAVYIIAHSYIEIRKTIAVLMEGAPPDFDFELMVGAVEGIEGVRDLHHVHVWRLDEERLAMEGHLVMHGADSLQDATEVKRRAKKLLREDFGIGHATLEIDTGPDARHEDTTIAEE